MLYLGPIIFDHDIGVPDQLFEEFDPLCFLQVEGDRTLVAVQILKVRTFA